MSNKEDSITKLMYRRLLVPLKFSKALHDQKMNKIKCTGLVSLGLAWNVMLLYIVINASSYWIIITTEYITISLN